MTLCVRCRQREADAGPFATARWESRCQVCAVMVSGLSVEEIEDEYPAVARELEVEMV
jgi:hypothetical protein